MKKFVISFLLLPLVTVANDGSILVPLENVPTQITATYANKNGFPTIIFSDGREAQIIQGLGKKIRTSVELKQIENTCAPQSRMARCQLQADMALLYVGVRWSVHSDPSKIGQTVSYTKTYPQTTPSNIKLESYQSYFFHYDTGKYNIYQSFFENDVLSCDSDEWLQGFQKTDSGYLIDSWAAESMNENAETGLNENMTDSAAYNLNLISLGGFKYAIGGIESSFSQTEIFSPYFAAQVNNLSSVSKEGQVCQLAFESDITQARKDLGLLEQVIIPDSILPLQSLIKGFEYPVGVEVKSMLFHKAETPMTWTVE